MATADGSAPYEVHRLGIAPADVDMVIATHAHYDHIGNLDAFPAAEVIISAREYDFWTGPLASRIAVRIGPEGSGQRGD